MATISNNKKIIVSPDDDTVYRLIIETENGQVRYTDILVKVRKKILHAKDPVTGVVDEITVYPTTKHLSKWIECKIDNEIGYITYDSPTNGNASILRCKIPNDDTIYRILKKIN